MFLLRAVAGELEEATASIGSNVSGVQGDVLNLADLDHLYETVKAKGKIDILFANVGLAGFVPLGSITEEYYDKTFDTNVKGLLFTVQKALPFLNDGASIILTGSVAAAKGTPSFGVYAASKAAIRSLVRTWTAELKDRRIRSNVLSPGPVATPQTARQAQQGREAERSGHRRAARLRADPGVGRPQRAACEELSRRPEPAARGGVLRRRRAVFGGRHNRAGDDRFLQGARHIGSEGTPSTDALEG
jgi:NAD(P)-dependent dehydrogenase (short-subunit alcohol dehydrogenase family)